MATATVSRRPKFVPNTATLLLTSTSKMPSKSWSLPARKTCPFSVHTPGAICEFCYADKGLYTTYPNVKKAQHTRFAWARECMRTVEGRDLFVSTMVSAIRGMPYFRVHDSGDMFSPIYARCWADICRQLPDTKFWIPTRSHRALLNVGSAMADIWAEALNALSILPNVTLRPSADNFGDPAPIVPGFAAGSTACDEGFTCPAPLQNNACGDCRMCWDAPTVPISYRKH